MSDTRIRELERKWRETSSDGDLERYVRELVRAGVIPAGIQGTNKPFAELSSAEKTYVRILAEHAQTMAGFGERLQYELYCGLRTLSIVQRTVEPDPSIPQDRLNAIIAETYANWIVTDVLELTEYASEVALSNFVWTAGFEALLPRVGNRHATEQERAKVYCTAVNLSRRILGTRALCAEEVIQLGFPLKICTSPNLIELEQTVSSHALPRPQKTYQMPDFLKVEQ